MQDRHPLPVLDRGHWLLRQLHRGIARDLSAGPPHLPVGDGHQPAGQAFAVAQFEAGLQQGHERRLGDVGGVRAIEPATECPSEDQRLVPRHQVVPRRRITGAASAQQVVVGATGLAHARGAWSPVPVDLPCVI